MQCVNKKITPTLYCNQYGGPSRMVLLTIRNLGLNVDLRYIDVYRGEQNTPEFLKINPQHQIPVLHIIEDNHVLTESRAIMMYLATAAKSSFYPVELKKRSLVDSRLFYDATTAQLAVKQFVVRFFIDLSTMKFFKFISQFSASNHSCWSQKNAK